jgi:hypothetical protein
MSSNQFQASNQQDSPSGASNSSVPSEGTRAAPAGEYPLPGTPDDFRFWAQLRQEAEEFQQQQQQQRQQQQEQVRLRTVEEIRQVVQQQQPQQAPQRDRNPWL